MQRWELRREAYRFWIKRISRERKTRIIAALDIQGTHRSSLSRAAIRLVTKIAPFVCAVKLNAHLVLPLGLFDGISKLNQIIHAHGLPVIMDAKLNDIGETNKVAMINYMQAGFNAVTVNPFVGYEGGLEPVMEISRNTGTGVLALLYMSHPGALEGYGQQVLEPYRRLKKSQYLVFCEKALKWRVDGGIVGATRPEKIVEIRRALKGRLPIYSPGIGAQGGLIERSVRSGANYLIIGRSLIESKNPDATARKVCSLVNQVIAGYSR